MGAWGAGNFQDDGALDYVGELVDSFSERIEEILKDEGRVELDEEGESVLMPTVKIISLLCKECNAAPPKPEVVQTWHQKYLNVFDTQIDGLSPEKDFKRDRRNVIDETFMELERQAREFWNQ